MYLAYVYLLTHKVTCEFYIGYRFANIKQEIHPEDDLGKTYFTSSEYINQDNFYDYDSEIIFKTPDPDIAYDYENKLILENWKNPLLLNRHAVRQGTSRFKITEDGVDKLRKINKNKKWFNNGTNEIHAHACPDGFKPGRLINPFPKQKKSSNKGYQWFNNGIKQIMLPPDNEVPVGFTKGRLPSTKETNEKISAKMKAGSASAKGKKWYTDGTKSILAFECPEGWKSGHSNGSGDSHKNRDYSGYNWYTDGKVNKRARSCPLGFVIGRTNLGSSK